MIRKTFFMVATAVAVCFAADSAWACKFLDNACCRYRRVCVWTYPCVSELDCCLPATCGPAATGSIKLGEGTLTITPSEKPKEAPKTESLPTPEVTPAITPTDIPAEPKMPTPPPESTTPIEKAVEPKPAIPAVAEPPKEPAPAAEPVIAEPPKEPAPVAEPPKEPAMPVEAEAPKAKPAEPETDAFGNAIAEPPKKATEETPAEPKAAKPEAAPPKKVEEERAAEPKAAEPEAAPPKKANEEPAAEPKAAEPVAEPPKAPAEPEKKEEADPFGKNQIKDYRLWTDASGEFQVNARFVGFADGKVRLQKPNGKYVRIEMTLLCVADQRLLRHVESLAGNW
jgi:hypothetical protein